MTLFRLATHSCRGLSHSAKNVARFEQTGILSRLVIHPCRGLSHSAKNVARSAIRSPVKQEVRTGATLVERLIEGHPAVRPFMLAVCSALGLGAIAYVGLRDRANPSQRQNRAEFPEYVRDRVTLMYGYLAASVAVTAAACMAVSRLLAVVPMPATGIPYSVLVPAVVIALGSTYIPDSIPYENTVAKHAAWLTSMVVIGAAIAGSGPAIGRLMALVGSKHYPMQFSRIMWYKAGVAAGLSTVGMTAPSEWHLEAFAKYAMLIGAVLAYGTGWFFLPAAPKVPSPPQLCMYGLVVINSLGLLAKRHQIVERATKHPQDDQIGELCLDGMRIKPFDPITAVVDLI